MNGKKILSFENLLLIVGCGCILIAGYIKACKAKELGKFIKLLLDALTKYYWEK